MALLIMAKRSPDVRRTHDPLYFSLSLFFFFFFSLPPYRKAIHFIQMHCNTNLVPTYLTCMNAGMLVYSVHPVAHPIPSHHPSFASPPAKEKTLEDPPGRPLGGTLELTVFGAEMAGLKDVDPCGRVHHLVYHLSIDRELACYVVAVPAILLYSPIR
ncbi:hypothetical protein F5Y11DRAFT_100207 [Daldinia sp. FL1419]|nr:hypothetical protein F5Y11DRAFT_100207 [Daldinia sp. FL1419]